MNIEELDQYCMQKKGVTVSTPFDEVTLVYKVMNKMFALINSDSGTHINLKCDPEYALELRAMHVEIQPGFHMSKKHWNTVALNESYEDRKVYALIDHSYDLIVKSLTKKLRTELAEM
ncbi:MmcQ/YjbR family DNA-binding protein [Putridiphycobacter roseus]|uniref:MmcQ/YjbR family DNA-binding protein n=1 Tax=Putridiphycobacter roseus TaxID=2219161 RepID=A0A2W1N721_9FLAO|nr:MmcQ/YjbR family DNA-binding protein [Putridiphycobacter roseus]PZE18921.1 MmcQ/YjbR family DNA-binding protein [Putridiphycobacter roseus]